MTRRGGMRPYLVIRHLPAVDTRADLPTEITRETEAVEYAANAAKEAHRKVCLVWSRLVTFWFAEDGTLTSVKEGGWQADNAPRMRIRGRGQKFLLSEDGRPSGIVG